MTGDKTRKRIPLVLSQQERARLLIRQWMAGSGSAEVREDIREWFLDDRERKIKDKAFESVFREYVKEERYPDKSAYEAMRANASRLGLPDDRIMPLPEAVAPGKRLPSHSSVRSRLLRVAAVLFPALILAGFIGFQLNRQKTDVPVQVAANLRQIIAVEAQQEVFLPDGSRVWINSGSSLSYPDHWEKERKVFLDGEAHFVVERDTERPFIVQTPNLTAEVLGTEFNVSDRAGLPVSEVILASGSLAVTAGGNDKMILSPNDRLTYDKTTSAAIITPSDPGIVSPWRIRIRLRDASLEEVLREIGHTYGVGIEIRGALSETEKVTATFDYQANLEDVLFIIHNTIHSFDYQIANDTVIITNR